MFKRITLLLLGMVMLSSNVTFAQEINGNEIETASSEAAAIESSVQWKFFHGIGCPHCARVIPALEEFEDQNPNVEIEHYEIYQNRDNGLVFNQLLDEYSFPQNERGVPALFVNDNIYIGDTPIVRFLESYEPVESNGEKVTVFVNGHSGTEESQIDTDDSLNANQNLTVDPDIKTAESGKYSLWAIAGAAFVDSINPCAIAVLLILLGALLLSTENKRRALMGGLAFTASIYISYFLFGLGILKAITFFNVAGIIYPIVGVLAILIGLANIKDFFWYGKGFVMEIPLKWRPTLKKLLKNITSPLGAFAIGFVVMLFELPCTGGPYFFVLGLLAENASWTEIVPVLLFYNLVFVLPLLLITLLIFCGYTSVENAVKWKDKNIRVLHLIAGLIMLALGIWVFLN